MGFSTNPDKTVLPSTSLVLLGIQLDTITQELRIDHSRLTEIMDLIEHWSTKRRCTKRQFQSLIKKLHFVCHACCPGRIFLRRMIDVLCKVQQPTHHICLNRAFHNDLLWWKVFLLSWNGCSFFYDADWISSSRLELYTDASHAGFGVYFSGQWLYGSFQWTQHFHFLAPLCLKSYMPLLLRSTHGLVNSPVAIFFFIVTTPLWCRLYLMAQAGADILWPFFRSYFLHARITILCYVQHTLTELIITGLMLFLVSRSTS